MESPDHAKLNDALLTPSEEKLDAAKRNSKDDLVAKIVKCCEDGELELPYSDSKLKRMTKTQLTKLLGECIEEKIRNAMAEQVGAKRGSGDRVIALGALKMIHSIAANGAEKVFNIFLPKYGYEVDGFSKSLQNPAVDEAVTACLEEIAADTDVLQYIESPYTRLAIAWSGALITSIKKTTKNKRYAPRMEPRQTNRQNPIQFGPGGGPADGQEFSRIRFAPEDAKPI
jgi:hypothetical protein